MYWMKIQKIKSELLESLSKVTHHTSMNFIWKIWKISYKIISALLESWWGHSLHYDESYMNKNQLAQDNLSTSREFKVTLHAWMNYTVGLRPRKNVIASFIILTGLSLNLRTRLNLPSGVIPIPAFKSPPSG